MPFDARVSDPVATAPDPGTSQDLRAHQLDAFRRQLLDMRRQRVDRCEQSRRDLAAQAPTYDRNDQASLEERWRLEMALRQRDAQELREIDAALHRIDTGEYGWCERTGEPIGLDRLRANPLARTVVREAD